MARLEIQNIQSVTERAREYFGLRGSIKPELDEVVSPTVTLQDMSALQGRGLPACSNNGATAAAAPESLSAYLFNDPDLPPAIDSDPPRGRRLIFLEAVTANLTDAAGAPVPDISISMLYGPGDPGFGVNGGLSRDLRERNPITSLVSTSGVTQSNNGAPFAAYTARTMIDRTPAAGSVYWGSDRAGLLLLPDWGVRVTTTGQAIGDVLSVMFSWREVKLDATPVSP